MAKATRTEAAQTDARAGTTHAADAATDSSAEAGALASSPAVSEPARKIVFGMQPNPPLTDLNPAAERMRAARSDGDFMAAQRALAKAFRRRVV